MSNNIRWLSDRWYLVAAVIGGGSLFLAWVLR